LAATSPPRELGRQSILFKEVIFYKQQYLLFGASFLRIEHTMLMKHIMYTHTNTHTKKKNTDKGRAGTFSI